MRSQKAHLKRLAMPNTWQIQRKKRKFITRPFPGMHSLREGVSFNTVLKEILGYAKTTKDTLNILNKREVLVDKKRIRQKKFIVGLMDIIEFPQTKESFRIVLNKKGKINAIQISEKENNLKLCRVAGKSLVKGKIQLNLHDGRNILTDKKDIKSGDSIVIELPGQKIAQHLKFEPGCLVYFTQGKNIGKTAKLKEIKQKIIICESGKTEFETSRGYAFVIGKETPVIGIKNE